MILGDRGWGSCLRGPVGTLLSSDSMEEGFQRKPGRDDRDPGCRWYNWGRHSSSPDGEDIPEDSWRKDSSRTWRGHGLCGPCPEHGCSTSPGRGRDSEGTHVSACQEYCRYGWSAR